MPSNHLILYHPLLFLPLIFPSIRVFSSELALHIRWPKYWSFSFIISPSNEYSGLISSKIDWFDLFAVQGTLKSLLQNHSSKASVLQCLAFFITHTQMLISGSASWEPNPRHFLTPIRHRKTQNHGSLDSEEHPTLSLLGTNTEGSDRKRPLNPINLDVKWEPRHFVASNLRKVSELL